MAWNGQAYRKPGDDDGRKAVVHLSRTGRARLKRVNALISGRLPSIPAWSELRHLGSA